MSRPAVDEAEVLSHATHVECAECFLRRELTSDEVDDFLSLADTWDASAHCDCDDSASVVLIVTSEPSFGSPALDDEYRVTGRGGESDRFEYVVDDDLIARIKASR